MLRFIFVRLLFIQPRGADIRRQHLKPTRTASPTGCRFVTVVFYSAVPEPQTLALQRAFWHFSGGTGPKGKLAAARHNAA